MSERPELVLKAIGSSVTWQTIEMLWLYLMTAYKLLIWFMIFLNLWITLWARNLARTERETVVILLLRRTLSTVLI